MFITFYNDSQIVKIRIYSRRDVYSPNERAGHSMYTHVLLFIYLVMARGNKILFSK